MKKIISLFLMLSMVLTVVFASSVQTLAAEDGNTVLVMKGRVNEETHEIEIDITVKENTGVCGMLLSLVYDTSVFTLVDLDYGTAFSSLSPISTNTETDEGYGIYPFKITYLGEENDTSIGHMMTLRFSVKDDAPDGSYIITLNHERDQDVTYLKDNKILTKNLLIDGAKITLSGNKITQIDTLTDNEQISGVNDSDALWFSVVIGGLVMISVCSLLISLHIMSKKQRNGKRYDKQ